MKPKNGVYKSLGNVGYLYGVCPLVAGNNWWAIDVFYYLQHYYTSFGYICQQKFIINYSFIFTNKIITGTSSPSYAKKKAVALQSK